MSYVVLARKWRPQTFDDLIGQGHVSTTLANAIARDRVAHAFLFTGVRGVGKTTSARILAKALNCAQGPTARPCLQCPPCLDIAAGADVDVQEIDGASYTGIDDVRRLQETLPYRPARDRYKIFIVDEVHMLSAAAWNAFLKTLEEPPPHVKFIFATTEVHKVPITILSRCQRYDFKLIRAQEIHARLRHVVDREGVPVEDGALAILAREAAGSMRDAMSLLDQVVAWVGIESDTLTTQGVSRVLGVAARTVLHRLGAALLRGDAAEALRVVDELANEGFDLTHVAKDFLAHLRDLVVARVAAEPGELLDVPPEEAAELRALAAAADADDLTRLQLGFSRAFDDIARSGQPRAALEMTLVRLARRPPLLPLDELLRRLGDLERRLAQGGGGAPPPGPAALSPTPVRPTPAPRPGEAPPPWASKAPPPSPPRSTFERSHVPAPTPVVPPTAMPAPAAPSTPAEPGSGEGGSGSLPDVDPGEPPAAAVGPEALALWRDILRKLAESRPALASALEHGSPQVVEPGRLLLAYESGSFLARQVLEPSAVEVIGVAVSAALGATTKLELQLTEGKPTGATVAQIDAVLEASRLYAARQLVRAHPLVVATLEHLGAELRDVRLTD